MKKITLIAVSLLLSANVIFAQESSSSKTEEKQKFVSSAFLDNWNLSFGAGLELHRYLTSPTLGTGVPMSVQFDFALTKWLNPYVGIRGKGSLSTFKANSSVSANNFVPAGETSVLGAIVSIHGDVLFDAISIFGGHKDNRFYSIKPYLGTGLMVVQTTNGRSYTFMPLAGLLNEFKINKDWSIHVDLSLTAPSGTLYGESSGRRFATAAGTAGLTYHFGKKHVRTFERAISQEKFDKVEAQNKTLSSDAEVLKVENDKLKKDVKALQNQLKKQKAQATNAKKTNAKQAAPAKVATSEFTPVIVFFEIYKCNVSKRDVARLKYVAEQIKNNPNVKFLIEGHADAETGSKEQNMLMSQLRAEAVCKVLVQQYGVSSSQVEPVAYGCEQDLFGDVTLNRASIIKVKTK